MTFSDNMCFTGIQNSNYKQISISELLNRLSPGVQKLTMEETLQYLLVENDQPSINASFWIENNNFSMYPSKEYLESIGGDFISFFFHRLQQSDFFTALLRDE